MGQAIIQAITNGLGLISNLAEEFLDGFTTLIWNSTTNALTNWGIFAFTMLGISVSFAIVKLILNVVRGNTGA